MMEPWKEFKPRRRERVKPLLFVALHIFAALAILKRAIYLLHQKNLRGYSQSENKQCGAGLD